MDIPFQTVKIGRVDDYAMRGLSIRLTVRRMTIVVALAGLCFALARVHVALGTFAACVSCLALVRTFGTIDRLRALGVRMTLGKRFWVHLDSWGVSIIIIGLADVTFLLIYPFFEKPFGCRPGVLGHYFSNDVNADGVVIGTLVAVFVAYRLKKALWPYEREKRLRVVLFVSMLAFILLIFLVLVPC